VIQDDKVCGYIFARADGKSWAYMLPIEPVLLEIARVYSEERRTPVAVDIPDAETMKALFSLSKKKDVLASTAAADEVQHETSNINSSELRAPTVAEGILDAGPTIRTISSEQRLTSNDPLPEEQSSSFRAIPQVSPALATISSTALTNMMNSMPPASPQSDPELGVMASSANVLQPVHPVLNTNGLHGETNSLQGRNRRRRIRRIVINVGWFTIPVIFLGGGLGTLTWLIATRNIPVYAKVLSTVLGFPFVFGGIIFILRIFLRRTKSPFLAPTTPMAEPHTVYPAPDPQPKQIPVGHIQMPTDYPLPVIDYLRTEIPVALPARQ
jgi:hypothetical protein